MVYRSRSASFAVMVVSAAPSVAACSDDGDETSTSTPDPTGVTWSTSSSGGAGGATTTSATGGASTTGTGGATTTMGTGGTTTTGAGGSTTTGAGGSGGGTGYGRTIIIDGVNDFNADETFATTTAGYSAYVSWDLDYLYFGLSGTDVSTGAGARWVIAYLGGATGTTQGVLYNTQQPMLPFNAGYHLRWKADNTYTNTLAWDGANWVDAQWNFVGNVFQSGTFLEVRVPWSDLGDPSTIDLHLQMLFEGAPEATYAGMPSGSFADGYDPDVGAHFTFDRSSPMVPAAYSPQ